MTIKRNKRKHTLTLHQGTYIREFLRHFDMRDCKHAATPTSTNGPREFPLIMMDNTYSTHYRSVTGALLYALVATRQDNIEIVNRLCKFISNPSATHMEDAKTRLR
jgi:hypothetical protein